MSVLSHVRPRLKFRSHHTGETSVLWYLCLSSSVTLSIQYLKMLGQSSETLVMTKEKCCTQPNNSIIISQEDIGVSRHQCAQCSKVSTCQGLKKKKHKWTFLQTACQLFHTHSLLFSTCPNLPLPGSPQEVLYRLNSVQVSI